MNTRRISTVMSIGALAVVTACSSSPPRGEAYGSAPIYSSQPVYDQAPAYPQPVNAYAQYGQVRAIDLVPVEARTTGGGAVIGAVLGAVVGNQIGTDAGRRQRDREAQSPRRRGLPRQRPLRGRQRP